MSSGRRFNRGPEMNGGFKRSGSDRDGSFSAPQNDSPQYWERKYRIKNFKDLYPRDFDPNEAEELTKWLFQKEKTGFLSKTKSNSETIKEILSLEK